MEKAKETAPQCTIKTEDEMKLEMLRQILKELRGHKGKLLNPYGKKIEMYSERIRSMKHSISHAEAALGAQESGAQSGNAVVTTGSLWTKTTVTSSFFLEAEHVAYSTTGNVRTADGRNICFNIDLEMSRAFCEENESLVQENVICIDPLVINIDASTVKVTDQKFLFDLDADGKEEEISFTKEGSGFLALDKNGDGRVNDGSELFGTKSGDGFADLAAYDEDGNGWIDEADDVFDNLKIWMKDEQGNDRLVTIRDAGVGAIYLGSADTEYHLNDMEANKNNAVLRKTGVFLKENGDVGTIQHVDLTL